jgi:cobalt-zinc-cadmium resistance protein CzcA
VPLQLRGPQGLRESPDALQALRLTLADGREISLDQVATLKRTDGPVAVKRENAARFTVVQSNVAGRDLVGFVEEAKTAVAAQVTLPSGYSLTWGGQFENQQRAAQRLMIVVPVALLLIGFLLYATFGDARPAPLVMMNQPLAPIGGISRWRAGEYLSVPAWSASSRCWALRC